VRGLTPDDIETRRSVGRRSLLGLLGASLGGAVALATGCGGREGPPANGGGERPATGSTEGGGETGAAAGAARSTTRGPEDRAAGGTARSATVDSDATDPAGSGRNPVSDSDAGPNSDAAGHGRTGITDSDSGPGADLAGHGRGTNGGAIQMED
jgi:hypothetical protein